jgi:YgiT-type zinc finger domain-containing protein
MKCIHCQGKMERGTAPFHIDRKGYHLMFDSIRAWVCTQCGEAYFEEPEVEAIQDAITALDHRAEKNDRIYLKTDSWKKRKQEGFCK